MNYNRRHRPRFRRCGRCKRGRHFCLRSPLLESEQSLNANLEGSKIWLIHNHCHISICSVQGNEISSLGRLLLRLHGSFIQIPTVWRREVRVMLESDFKSSELSSAGRSGAEGHTHLGRACRDFSSSGVHNCDTVSCQNKGDTPAQYLGLDYRLPEKNLVYRSIQQISNGYLNTVP